MNVTAIAGPSALLAAVATLAGAVFLVLFFRRGQPWGTLNDVASIVMMLATIPVLLFVAQVTGPYAPSVVQGAVAVVGIAGMLGASIAQGLLVARIRSYEALLPWTLGSGAVVGAWYLAAGVLLLLSPAPEPLAVLAMLSGVGYLAVGYGFWRGNERHPLSVGGGVVLLVASTTFLLWIGVAAVAIAALNR